jgi:outer membrane protein OmpA-like peptidoglycan-associated protein
MRGPSASCSAEQPGMRAIASAIAALTLAACAQPPKPPPPPPPPAPVYSERVILLPSRDGTPSTLVIERPTGTVVLTTPFEAVDLDPGVERRSVVETSEVEKRYGGVLQAQPAQPFAHVMYFDTGTTRLTPSSRASLELMTQRIRGFPAPQVMVVGHTDRVGAETLNEVLSMRRALAVRGMLMDLGVAPGAIEVSGRGEREPLVPTADGVAEERNRRVEMNLR